MFGTFEKTTGNGLKNDEPVVVWSDMVVELKDVHQLQYLVSYGILCHCDNFEDDTSCE